MRRELLTGNFARGVAMGALVLAVFFGWRPVFYSYENMMLALDGSAARAAFYGALHMSSAHPYLYDLRRAEDLYARAATLDPSYPWVFHQLARISFLYGDYDRALAEIDLQIQMHGETEPNAYYVRGLIEGYAGKYAAASGDYEVFMRHSPHNWAAINDYAWVLLKDDRAKDAARATEKGLSDFPDNPWLLTTRAVALYETGNISGALPVARRAVDAVAHIQKQEWLMAYPGNDPQIASVGMATLQRSAQENLHMIERAASSSAVQ